MKAEQQNIKRLLNTAKGQIDGLNKMIDDDKYCIDISNQIMATIAILKKVNIEILDAHLKCCVLHADDRERETKINEISEVLKKALKSHWSFYHDTEQNRFYNRCLKRDRACHRHPFCSRRLSACPLLSAKHTAA